jgi:acyl-coenzyme A synthetase/AMP-(fatty) acid ligase
MVTAQLSSWLPLEPTLYCLVKTGSKLVILDAQRADAIEGYTAAVADKVGSKVAFLVWQEHEGKRTWQDMALWSDVLRSYQHYDAARILALEPDIGPEDNAYIMFTSGT